MCTRMHGVSWSVAALALLALLGACSGSSPKGTVRAAADATTSTSLATTPPTSAASGTTTQTLPCSQPLGSGPAAVATTTRLDHSTTDGANYRFSPPGQAQPRLSASDALSRAPQGTFTSGERLDAVLAMYEDLVHKGPPTLVWVLVDRNVGVAPSMGPPQCGTVSVITDANSGSALGEWQGAAVV